MPPLNLVVNGSYIPAEMPLYRNQISEANSNYEQR